MGCFSFSFAVLADYCVIIYLRSKVRKRHQRDSTEWIKHAAAGNFNPFQEGKRVAQMEPQGQGNPTLALSANYYSRFLLPLMFVGFLVSILAPVFAHKDEPEHWDGYKMFELEPIRANITT